MQGRVFDLRKHSQVNEEEGIRESRRELGDLIDRQVPKCPLDQGFHDFHRHGNSMGKR